jgi:hypothetical protein
MAIHWGSLKDDGCVGPGLHRFSAVLWEIPWGKSWEVACASTPGASGTRVDGLTPTRCDNTGLNMWGVWIVPDATCAASWGTLSDSGCSAVGMRKFSALLLNIPPGQSWATACSTTPAPVGSPVAGLPPTRCINTGVTGMWGEWDVPDTKCSPNWGPLSTECIDTGRIKHSAILWNIVSGASWTGTCQTTPGAAGTPVEGILPTKCVNTGLNVWGEWELNEPKCVCENRAVRVCRSPSSATGKCEPGETRQGSQCCKIQVRRLCHFQSDPLPPPSGIVTFGQLEQPLEWLGGEVQKGETSGETSGKGKRQPKKTKTS